MTISHASVPSAGRGRRRRRHPLTVALDYLLLTAVTAAFTAPICYLVIGSFKPDTEVLAGLRGFLPTHLSLDNYRHVFERFDGADTGYFLGFYGVSLAVTATVVLGGLLVNSLAGFAFARLQWRGRDVVFGAVLALAILPFEAIAVPLFYMLNDYRNTIEVQAVPFIANAMSIYLFATFFHSIPVEIEEAARIDGAGPWRIFFQVILPMSKPAFATVAILTFLTQWGSFLWPVLMVSDPAVRPLPLAISVFRAQPPFAWGEIMAFGVMMVLPVLVTFLVFQRWFIRSVAASAVKG